MEFKPGMNYHWESSSYVTPWNMDKHLNDEGGCDGPNISVSHWKITQDKEIDGKCMTTF